MPAEELRQRLDQTLPATLARSAAAPSCGGRAQRKHVDLLDMGRQEECAVRFASRSCAAEHRADAPQQAAILRCVRRRRIPARADKMTDRARLCGRVSTGATSTEMLTRPGRRDSHEALSEPEARPPDQHRTESREHRPYNGYTTACARKNFGNIESSTKTSNTCPPHRNRARLASIIHQNRGSRNAVDDLLLPRAIWEGVRSATHDAIDP